jgi:hypothetical protein
MAPAYVAALHSGKLIIDVPAPTHLILILPGAGGTEILEAELTGFAIGGTLGGIAAGSSAGAEVRYRAEQANATLKPYVSLIRAIPLRQEFLVIGRKAAANVAWIGNGSSAKLYEGSGSFGSGEMHRLTQVGGVQAIAFMMATIAFSPDLEQVYAIAHMEVYARGAQHANFIDGGMLYVSTTMTATGPALKSFGVEGIASSKPNDKAALGARANLWFEDNGKRFKRAVARDMAGLQTALGNYLTGRRRSH